MSKIEDADAEQIVTLRRRGLSVPEIAAVVHRRKDTIGAVLRAAGLNQRGGAPPDPLTEDERARIIAMRRRGATLSVIAQTVHRSLKRVSDTLSEAGLLAQRRNGKRRRPPLAGLADPASHPAVIDAPFIKPPSRAQLMAGRAMVLR